MPGDLAPMPSPEFLAEMHRQCDERLAAERRATVERIRKGLIAKGWLLDEKWDVDGPQLDVLAVLDEAAQR